MPQFLKLYNGQSNITYFTEWLREINDLTQYEALHTLASFALHHSLYPAVRSSALAYRCKAVWIGNFPKYFDHVLFSYHH